MSTTRKHRWSLAGLLAGCAIVFASGTARADRLDAQLNKEAPKVLEHLKQQGYRNVGVLRFRVEVGSRAPSFTSGAINGNMVIRLQNALIAHMQSDDKSPLGIIHDAGAVAGRHKVGDWFTKPVERKKLFGFSDYPLAWGTSKVKPDAFLTGIVKLPADLSSTMVIIEAFDVKSPEKLHKVTSVTFDTDRNVIRDIGKNFVLEPGAIAGKTTRQVDQFILTSARKRNGDQPPSDKPRPDNVGGIEFKMMSAETAIEFKEPSTENDPFQVKSPNKGKPVVMTLTNKTEKKLGVVLKLNGSNSLGEQSDPPETCAKWIVGPGKTYTIKGFYTGEGFKSLSLFKVLDGDQAQEMTDKLSDKAGLIEIDVFSSDEMASGDQMEVSSRSTKPYRNSVARRSLPDLQKAILKDSLQKKQLVGKREIVVKDEEATAKVAAGMKLVDFPNPKPVGRLAIKIIKGDAGMDPGTGGTGGGDNP